MKTPLLRAAAFAVLAAFASAPLAYTQDDAAALYKTKCAACHAANGSGDTPAGKKMNAQPFSSAEFKKQSDEQLFAVIKNGKNKMPAYSAKLTDEQIKDLVKYIKTLSK